MLTFSAARSLDAADFPGHARFEFRWPWGATSILPKAVKAPRIHLSVARRIGDLAMPQIGRQGPRIDALIDQLEAAGVAQQVRVNPGHANALSRPRQHLEEPIGRHRGPAFT